MIKETRKTSMSNFQRVMAVTVTAILVQIMISALGTAALAQGNGQESSRRRSAGAVFAMTNVTAGNEIVVYSRASDGTLERLNRSVRTRGLGIGVDTDTQGPLRLSNDNRFLFAVNPGSDNITVFEVNGTRLRFLQIMDAGDQPLSLTISGNLLYMS